MTNGVDVHRVLDMEVLSCFQARAAAAQGQQQPTTFPPRPKFNAEDRVIYFCGSCISLHGRSGGQ